MQLLVTIGWLILIDSAVGPDRGYDIPPNLRHDTTHYDTLRYNTTQHACVMLIVWAGKLGKVVLCRTFTTSIYNWSSKPLFYDHQLLKGIIKVVLTIT